MIEINVPDEEIHKHEITIGFVVAVTKTLEHPIHLTQVESLYFTILWSWNEIRWKFKIETKECISSNIVVFIQICV